jgi:integrase/recombinase XerC/integrase/recombinase XerD
LSYDAARMMFKRAQQALGSNWTLHDLRHSAAYRFNSGVSIEVVRRRLGHASTETTQAYALLADKVADTEIRAARRKRETRRRSPDPVTCSLSKYL